MEIKLTDLLDLQKQVNKKVLEKLERPVNTEEFILAFNVEFFEFLNEIGTWKWWKHSHVPNRERILDELADLYAFFLSIMLNNSEIDLKMVEDELTRIVNEIYKDREQKNLINDIILVLGTDNEIEKPVPTLNRFAIAIGLTRLLFDGITYDEITEAYRKKSQVNIDRQNENY